MIWPLLIGLVAFGLVSAPFWTTIGEPTSLSIGNRDIAGSAGAATYLKEHSRSDQIGFLGQSDAYKWVVEMEIFGGPFASAFLSSLLGLETYQIQSLHINLFFLFAVLATYILTRTAYGYRQPGAILVTAAFAFNPIMVYVALHGFQGQIVVTAWPSA